MPNSTALSGSARGGGQIPDLHPVSMSEYHQSCVPAQDRERAAALAAALLRRAAASNSGSMPASLASMIKGDAITQDRVWTRSIQVEKDTARNWASKWKFMTEYDWKGDPREPDDDGSGGDDKLPSGGEYLPRSDAMNYGRHLATEHGRTIQQLQRRFDANHRKRRLPNELGTQ